MIFNVRSYHGPDVASGTARRAVRQGLPRSKQPCILAGAARHIVASELTTGMGSSIAGWNYRRTKVAGIVELGAWCGTGSPGLRPHFHDETQIVAVLSGSRAFRINDSTVMVTAGQVVSIPAGMLHTPLATSDQDTICLNAYVSLGQDDELLRSFDIPLPPLDADGVRRGVSRIEGDILPGTAPQPNMETGTMKLRKALSNSLARIGEIAAGFDRSREGFSRRVTRELGVAPHTFRILARLNRARQLLREGQPIAAVAVEAGFSDQSHMTRLFRRTFGTTPGRYRRG